MSDPGRGVGKKALRRLTERRKKHDKERQKRRRGKGQELSGCLAKGKVREGPFVREVGGERQKTNCQAEKHSNRMEVKEE